MSSKTSISKLTKLRKKKNRPYSQDTLDVSLPRRKESPLKKKAGPVSKDELSNPEIGKGFLRKSKDELVQEFHDAEKRHLPEKELNRIRKAIDSYETDTRFLIEEYNKNEARIEAEKQQKKASKNTNKKNDDGKESTEHYTEIFFRGQGKASGSPKELAAMGASLEKRGVVKNADTLFNEALAVEANDLDKMEAKLLKNNPHMAKALPKLKAALENGDWVLINDKHLGVEAFALARYVMKNTTAKGKVLLEAPYALNWDNNLENGMIKYADQQAKQAGPGAAIFAKASKDMEWEATAIDALGVNTQGVDVAALEASKVPGTDQDFKSNAVGNFVRQNYIGRNAHYEMQKSAENGTGGLAVYGGMHITGNGEFGELPLQNMVSSKHYDENNQIKLSDDYFAVVISKGDLLPKPVYSSGPPKDEQTLEPSVIKKLASQVNGIAALEKQLKPRKKGKPLSKLARDDIQNRLTAAKKKLTSQLDLMSLDNDLIMKQVNDAIAAKNAKQNDGAMKKRNKKNLKKKQNTTDTSQTAVSNPLTDVPVDTTVNQAPSQSVIV